MKLIKLVLNSETVNSEVQVLKKKISNNVSGNAFF